MYDLSPAARVSLKGLPVPIDRDGPVPIEGGNEVDCCCSAALLLALGEGREKQQLRFAQ